MEVAIAFLILLLIFLASPTRRMMIYQKSFNDWVLDFTGLSIQGTLIPLIQTVIIATSLRYLLPTLSGVIDISNISAFLLNFVIIDYLYYCNHRLLHSSSLWPFHRVHHSVNQFDLMATSRNSVWSSFLIIYVWVNGLFLYLLKDPSGYILAMSTTAILDIWRHSQLETKHLHFENFLSKYCFLITPREHATHHDKRAKFNFGANLNIFDKIHGTYARPNGDVWKQLGINHNLSLSRALFYPFNSTSSKRK